MRRVSKSHPLRRWFAGLVEHSFQREVGLCNPSVLDYLVEMLTEFIHVERINTVGDGSGRRVEDLVQMLAEVEAAVATGGDERRRVYHRHIGDYTLFWTGVYPENLKRMHRFGARDDLLSYLEWGKRSYAIAADLSTEQSTPPAGVLQTLSDQFECCVYGLGLVRMNWEKADPPGPAKAGLVVP